MVFKKGQVANPNGNPSWKTGGPSPNPHGRAGDPNKLRVHGARTKATARKIAELNERGDLDPLDYLSSLVSAENVDPALRTQAAQAILPYRHSRMGNTPVPPDPVFFDPETEFHLPHEIPSTINEVNSNITYIHQLKLAGKLDQAWANDLINDQRIIGNNLLDQAKLIAAQGGHSEQTIRIEGGMPELPGTNIIMPPIHNGVPVAVIDAQANPAITTTSSAPDATSSPHDGNSSHE
jgi:hypothetical protein